MIDIPKDKSYLIKAASVLRLAETGEPEQSVEQAERLAEILDEKGYFKKPVKGTPKKKPEQKEKPGVTANEIPDVRPTDMLDEQDYKSYLQEYCQGIGWDLPEYELESANSGFICVCSIWHWEDQLKTKPVYAKNKKEATKLAAQYMVTVSVPEHEQSA